MTLRPSTASQRVPLPSPPASSLPDGPDPESDSLRAASPTVTRFLATAVTDPLFDLVAESASASVCPLSVGGECALGTDVLEDRQENLECFAAASPHLVSMLLAPEGDPDALDIPTPRSYAETIEGTYVDEVPPPGANIVSGMWIFRVKWPPGSPPAFKARYVARGFSQRQGVDFFQTFSPTPKMTTLRVLLHAAAQRDYELHSLDFSTAFLQGSLHEEIWLRRPPGFTGSFPAGTQWSLRRPVYGLRQALREWHDTLRTTLAALGFAPSTADPSLFLRTDATLPPFYVLVYVDDLVFATADTEALAHVKSKRGDTCAQTWVLQSFGFTYSSPQSTPVPTGHSLSAPPSDKSVEPSGPYPELVGCLMYLMTCTRPDLAYPLSLLACYVAPGRHRKGYTFSLGSGSVSWRSTRSSSVLSSSCEAEIYAGAMAAQELRWLTYLLTDLGEAPRSPLVLYVDNKAMLALCQEHRLEHRTKHIALRYFLARELQQRGQLCLAYVASQANTADVFTKALQPCDHQPCLTFLDWSCGVEDEVDSGARFSGNNGTKQRGVIKVDGGIERSQARVQQSTAAAGSSHADVDEPQLEVAGLKSFADGIVPIPSVDDVGLRGEFRAAHLLTFMVISRCCSPVVQLVLRICRERLDAGHHAWHFILSTYQARDDLYIAQLEEKMTHIRMGEQESATDYCNRARRILAEVRMAGAEYSTASYISHIVKGLPRGYNLMKRMMMVPGMRESLDEDSITSYILQDEAMQEAEQPTELLPQVNYATPTKLNQQQGQCRKPGGGGSGGGRSTMDVDEKRSTRDKGRGGGGRRRECWICHDPDHLCYECPDRDDSVEDDTEGIPDRSTSRRPSRDANPRKEKQTSSAKDVDNSSGMSRGDGEALCSMVGVAESTVLLAPDAGEDFQAVATAVQSNPMAVLLDSGFSHHLMGTKVVFVDMAPSDGVKHVRGFNGALQPVEGHGTIVLQGEVGKRVLIPDMLYVPGIQANLLSAGQLKKSGMQLQGDGDEMLLVAATGEVLGRAHYNGRVLCTDLRPCSMRSLPTEVVALRTIVSATKLTPGRLHARLAHVSVDTIKSSAKQKVATGLDITPSTGADPPCVSCVGGKLARHTFPDKGSDAEEALGVMHIDLCGPFRVAAKDGNLFFLLLKDRHTRFVWVMPVAKKSDVLREFQKWLVLVERQAKKSVLMLRSDRGGEFLRKEFTDFVDGKGIVYDLTCPYTPQKNGMAEREMRTTVESVRTMLLHMGVQHHWWHLALRQAVWVRNCLEWSTTLLGTTPYQLLTGKKPDLTLARVWGCIVQFMVPEQQRGGKLAPKAR
ncbi:unnamed protein product [Closterium sp. NIES-53]